ncbi:MAG: chaperone modulator CbpM [Lutibacter sp.]|nr:chaperone modulator CbpM [Lutibacter sp.]MBP9600040.1 chaperone modulator CbpM [Lutibacter sp.]
MNLDNLITINNLCENYKIEISFLSNLKDFDLIEIVTIEQVQYIHQDKINDLEKIIRIHNELGVNMEGIDVVFNMLSKINELENELNSVRNRLSLYENLL